MAVKLSQSLKQTQSLMMTPQLQQAIKLLTLTHMEMTDLIASEMVENPMLEESSSEKDSQDYANETLESQAKETTAESLEERPMMSSENDDFDWNSYIDSYNNTSSTPSMVSTDPDSEYNYENMVSGTQTLADHLIWQLRMEDLGELELNFAELIIHNINDDGYLEESFDELIKSAKVEPDFAQNILELIQRLDPVGCGSSSLEDCLLAQARIAEERSPLLEKIIRNHLKDLQNRDHAKIAKATGTKVENVKDAEMILKNFHPKPGRLVVAKETHYITPDIYVVEVGGEFVVKVNDDGVPRLKISKLYQEMLKKQGDQFSEAQEFVSEKMRSALWLIKSIQNRQRTIEKVSKAILRQQQEFFRKGPQFLKPMILKDVANEIGMHESTVSRVTTNKFMHTPIGMFELKYFFNSGIGGKNGGLDVSSESLKLKIKQIIDNENPKKPFSDQKIVELLAREDLAVARRTVAKYREMLGVLSSSKRKLR